jgi:putative ABC transport system substrate-binding protein
MGGDVAEAQQPERVPHIGYLAPAKYENREEAFRQGLHELGYVEGRNIVIDWRIGEPQLDRLRELAAELVRLKVDNIVATSTFPVQASKDITKTIPIVFAGVLDPVGSGFVASLARPGGNITGLSLLAPELSGKRLELLKEAFPKISRVAVLWNTEHPATARLFSETKAAAQELTKSDASICGGARCQRFRWCLCSDKEGPQPGTRHNSRSSNQS